MPLRQVQQTVSWGSESLMRAAPQRLSKQTQAQRNRSLLTGDRGQTPDTRSSLAVADDERSDQGQFLPPGSHFPLSCRIESVFLTLVNAI